MRSKSLAYEYCEVTSSMFHVSAAIQGRSYNAVLSRLPRSHWYHKQIIPSDGYSILFCGRGERAG